MARASCKAGVTEEARRGLTGSESLTAPIFPRSCLASQDPYCGWHRSRGCVDIRGPGG